MFSVLTVLCFCTMMISSYVLFAQPTFLTGSGTPDSPYIIENETQFKQLISYVNGGGKMTYSYEVDGKPWIKPNFPMCFSLEADLDFGGEKISPMGTTDHPFAGKFNGNGHYIQNVTIKGTTNVGLFGYINLDNTQNMSNYMDLGYDGKDLCVSIEGIGLENSKVVGTGNNVGGIIGFSKYFCYIKNCYLRNTGVKGNEYVGGIIGNPTEAQWRNGGNYYAEMENCYVANDDDNNVIEGYNYVGGLIGNQPVTTHNCFAATGVTASMYQAQFGPVCGGVPASGPTISAIYYVEDWNVDDIESGSMHADVAGTSSATKNEIVKLFVELGDGFVLNPEDDEAYPILANQLNNKINTGALVKLYIDRWNFIGSFGDVKQLDNTTDGNDMAALEFDVAGNQWSEEDWMHASDDDLGKTTMTTGLGYFVYPFAYKPMTQEQIDKEEEHGDAIENKADEIGKYTYLKRTDGIKNADYEMAAMTNTSDNHWFAMSNPYSKPLYVASYAEDNSLQGNYVYTYNPQTEDWTYVGINAYTKTIIKVERVVSNAQPWAQVMINMKEFINKLLTEQL
ncbi:MAG: hypothetical protein J6M30_03250 [Bacteroidales bacterium]|nr:hypothetical protein [Bacteroidales bacterium]